MKQVRQIVAPIDLMGSSGDALDYAASLSRELGAPLKLLYALSLPPYVSPEMVVPSGDMPMQNLVEFARLRADREMAELVTELGKQEGLAVEGHVVTGPPADVILEFIETHQPDLTVMGTHGRTGLSHLLLGSVAEKVVRRSSRPVLVVPDSGAAATSEPEQLAEGNP